MDWLQSLLWDPSSVAHIVFLYAFVVAAGVYLGKIKIFGVSLGVTFVLFAGILMGHFGFTADTHILHFIREFGLILFVFCIGLQVGPSFFSSFKKGGMTLNLLAVGIVVLNIAVALGLYYLWNGRVELPMMVGILYGAVTNTPGLGAANEALNQLSYNGPQIALGYACAYPLGVVGIIGSIIAIRYIFRVNMTKEEESLKTQSGDAHHKPHMMSLEVRNESISGKTLIEISKILSGEAENVVSISYTKNHIVFEFDNTIVVSRLIEGEYFRIDQMLSNDYETKVRINKKELLNCIDRATLLVKEGDKKPIIINIGDELMELKIKSQIGSMNEEIMITKEGKDLLIGFNPKFLIDALRVIDDEEVTIYLMNAKAPCFIKDDEESYIYLILPVNFNAAA